MVWTTCKYAPEELFAGFGEEVERLDPNPVSFSCADGCAHPNLCGFAKAVIEEVKARDIRALVFTDCCDAMRRTYDVLARDEMEFLYMLPLPHKTGEREIRLFAGALRSLKEAYAEATGAAFSWEHAYEACRMQREEMTQRDVDRTGTEQPHAGQADVTQASPAIKLLGAHGGQRLLAEIRETFHGQEVRDETCSGNRAYSSSFLEGEGAEMPADEASFFLWYARALLCGLSPCMRMYAVQGRQSLTKPADPPKGIVYHTMKFCDYYSFEYTGLKEASGVPILKIETDTTPQSSGQLKTRIEAFYETLGGETEMFGRKKEKTNEPVRGREAQGAEQPIDKTGRYIAGIDSGSTSTDVVIMDPERRIVSSVILPTGMSASKSAEEALAEALSAAHLTRTDLIGVVATGYGREILEMEKRTITEITCHAKGAHFLFPKARTIIDIGGQDSKVIRIDEEGNVLHFVMNDKCAAGTGRFLEMQAKALGLTLAEMSQKGLKWEEDIQISNMCTVFAESEVVSLVARDTAVSDIIHGLNESVAAKTVSLVKRGKGEPGYCMTGGVSRNEGVVKCLETKLQAEVEIAEASQLCGAIGACLLGL